MLNFQYIRSNPCNDISFSFFGKIGDRQIYDFLVHLVPYIPKHPIPKECNKIHRQVIKDVFEQADVDGALAASVFHKDIINIQALKSYLSDNGIVMRKEHKQKGE